MNKQIENSGIKRLQKARQHGLKIVFTNGVFDILHYGHLETLRTASSLGNILIVGLNSEKSVRKWRNGQPTVMNEIERRRALEALPFINLVVMFDKWNPNKLIEEVKPDILVKGGNYSKDDIFGKEIVQDYGGEVIVTPLVEQISTSEIIKRCQKIKNN